MFANYVFIFKRDTLCSYLSLSLKLTEIAVSIVSINFFKRQSLDLQVFFSALSCFKNCIHDHLKLSHGPLSLYSLFHPWPAVSASQSGHSLYQTLKHCQQYLTYCPCHVLTFSSQIPYLSLLSGNMASVPMVSREYSFLTKGTLN